MNAATAARYCARLGSVHGVRRAVIGAQVLEGDVRRQPGRLHRGQPRGDLLRLRGRRVLGHDHPRRRELQRAQARVGVGGGLLVADADLSAALAGAASAEEQHDDQRAADAART